MTQSATPDLLETIVAAARRSVAIRRTRESEGALEMRAARREPRGARFKQALDDMTRINIIAECKRRSPSRGVLRRSYDPVAIARSYEAAGARAVSVLTEPTFFDGSLEHLSAVREAVELPLLRKDFIVDEYQLLEARANGADAVLLIVAALPDGALRTLLAQTRALALAALVEVHDVDELGRALEGGADLIGVNNRNLRTLAVDSRVSESVARRLPKGIVAVSESGLQSAEDLSRLRSEGYHGFLIGERFMTSPDPGESLSELLRGYALSGRA